MSIFTQSKVLAVFFSQAVTFHISLSNIFSTQMFYVRLKSIYLMLNRQYSDV